MNETAISVSGLEKRFGDVLALAGIDLAVDEGTVFGLLGPNGAGKTTAVRILSTILEPDAGEARVLGFDVARQPDEVRRRIGLAGQYAAVDGNLTGRENLMLIGRLAHLPRPGIAARADELLDRFGLSDAAGRLVRTYSGGMRRRLDLAAALVHRPPVLFLDEPTAALDPASRSDLWSTVEQLVGDGTTVLLTTQYLEEADRLANRIAIVDHGRVIAEGTTVELKQQLGATVVELAMADATAAHRAHRALAPSGLGAVDVEDRTVRLTSTDGSQTLFAAVRALDGTGLEPLRLDVREPTLDDVFLSLTGHRAEAAGDLGPASSERRAA